MRCSKCGRENRAGRKFCAQCGGGLTLVCSSCQAENEPGEQFCGDCGQRIAEPAKAPPPPEPRSYTPKHLADKILTSRSALEGERKQVTVLFADVKGSMELAEQVDPEEWHKIMDRFFAILADGVHRFECTVNQYTGDGIMALFGAPIAHEDHAPRACFAALHLQRELRHYADEVRLEHGLGFSVRMGLNSGEVVVGKIGDDLRMDYTAQGHTVGLAARMEQMADPGKALLTGHTAKLVSGYFQLRDLGETRIKGLSDPLRVFELEGVGRMRTRLDVSHARGFAKFVGRQSEMAALEAALEQAIAGNAQVVGVVAEAGTEKSRLCYEFAEGCRAREIPVYEAHGVAHGKAVPLLPVLEFWRGYFGITEHDTARAARDKIAGRMVLLDETLAEGLPLVFDFLGVPDPERPAPALGPEARQGQLFSLIRRLSRARSAREPAVLLFEDLHWFDRASDEFIENVVEISPGNRTLVLLNFRPEYHAQWMQRSYYQQLPLLPLGPEAIKELFADLLGNDPSLDRLRALIQERTSGNPFFIEEIVQSLIETGALAGTRGAYRLVRPAEEVGVPATVQSVLAARIDRLPEREKRVLQTASVIGKKFSEPILERVAELGGGDLSAALHALTSAEFLYQESLYPEAEYAFKHPLTQEVAYRSQLSERRASRRRRRSRPRSPKPTPGSRCRARGATSPSCTSSAPSWRGSTAMTPRAGMSTARRTGCSSRSAPRSALPKSQGSSSDEVRGLRPTRTARERSSAGNALHRSPAKRARPDTRSGSRRSFRFYDLRRMRTSPGLTTEKALPISSSCGRRQRQLREPSLLPINRPAGAAPHPCRGGADETRAHRSPCLPSAEPRHRGWPPRAPLHLRCLAASPRYTDLHARHVGGDRRSQSPRSRQRRTSIGLVRQGIDDVPAERFSGETQCRLNTFPREVWVGCEKLLDGFAGRELLENQLDADSRARDDGLAHQDLGIRYDRPFVHLHLDRLARSSRLSSAEVARATGRAGPPRPSPIARPPRRRLS